MKTVIHFGKKAVPIVDVSIFLGCVGFVVILLFK